MIRRWLQTVSSLLWCAHKGKRNNSRDLRSLMFQPDEPFYLDMDIDTEDFRPTVPCINLSNRELVWGSVNARRDAEIARKLEAEFGLLEEKE